MSHYEMTAFDRMEEQAETQLPAKQVPIGNTHKAKLQDLGDEQPAPKRPRKHLDVSTVSFEFPTASTEEQHVNTSDLRQAVMESPMKRTKTEEVQVSKASKTGEYCFDAEGALDDITVKQCNKRGVQFSSTFHVHQISAEEYADSLAIWWSNEELSQRLDSDVHEVASTSRKSLLLAMELCLGRRVSREESQVALRLAKSSCRGLERDMMPCLRERRKQVRSSVLQHQKELKNRMAGDGTMDGEASSLLASHYQTLSAPDVRLAQLLGRGDALHISSHV